MARQSRARAPFGVLSAVMKDHLYSVGAGGLIYTSPWIVTEPAPRYYATILLTSQYAPFDLAIAGTKQCHQAVALRQMTKRAVGAVNVRIMSFQLDPSHRHFARFRSIPSPGLLALPRALYAPFDETLDAAYCGQLSATEAVGVFESVVNATLPLLPPVKPPDRRVERVIELLWSDDNYPLEDLAAAVGLSYNRLSHLFAESMGLSLRMYQHWHKVRRAIAVFRAEGKRPLTDIAHAAGFTDSSHMCKAFNHAHGAPPSHFLNPAYVRIVSVGRRAAGMKQQTRATPSSEVAPRAE